MKKLFILFFALSASTAFSQAYGSETFDAVRDAVLPSVPAGFSVNPERAMDNRFTYQLAYDRDGYEQNTLFYTLYPGSEDFSEMDLASGGVPFTWSDRKALFNDGSQIGISGITVVLKNNVGTFSVSHMTLYPLKPMTKDELEQILAKVSFDKLENRQ